MNNEEQELLQVNATDQDTGVNADIRYSLLKPLAGFRVDPMRGIIFVNSSQISRPRNGNIFFTVVATDSGANPKSAMAAVLVYISERNSQLSQSPKQYR